MKARGGVLGRELVTLTLAVLAAGALVTLAPSAIAAVGSGVVRQSVMPEGQDIRERQYFGGKFVGRVEAGETVEILEEKEGWTRVRGARAEGWLRSHVLGPISVTGLREPDAEPRSAPSAMSHGTADPAPRASPVEASSRPGPSLSERSRQVVVRPPPPPPIQVAPPAPAARVAAPDVFARERDDSPDFRMPRASEGVDIEEGMEIAPARPLHLRSQPDWASQLVGRIPPNEAVRVVESRDDWSHVEASDGLEGWVRTAALTAPPLTPPWTPPPVQVVPVRQLRVAH